MLTNEEFDEIIARFHESMPRRFVTKMDYTNAGIGQVLHYLAIVSRPVSAGEISRHMGVSTARVAVLLKCMTEKGLIVKESDPLDARRSLVQLSNEGAKQIEKIKQKHYKFLSAVMEKIGMQRLNDFIKTLEEIHTVASETFEPHKPQCEKGV